jgi:short-subunit dehydrogenase
MGSSFEERSLLSQRRAGMAASVFKDKVVVITGASSGIGRELAYQLSEEGARLSLAARDKERLTKVAGECQARGGRAIAIVTDVSDQTQCAQLIQRTVESYDRIDILINNAGITMWANFEEVRDISVYEQMMRVNYFGSVYCTHYALPFLKKAKGQIIGISSLAGRNGIPKRSGYAASKHAMVGFFDTLRIELEEYGISVTMIYPDFVATETRERALGADGKPLGKSPVRESEVMSAERCAQLILQAVAARKRELMMTWRGKIGLWVKLVAPGVVDRIAKNAINEGR